jgi:hypothetical protein
VDAGRGHCGRDEAPTPRNAGAWKKKRKRKRKRKKKKRRNVCRAAPSDRRHRGVCVHMVTLRNSRDDDPRR